MVVPGTDPIDRLVRRPSVRALHLLPVLLFVGLAIGAWVRGIGESHSSWLQEAQALSAELRAFGPGALGMARTWADPRVPPSVALLSMGLSAPWVRALVHLLAILVGASTVGFLSARNRSAGGILAAFILASAPYFVDATIESSSHLMLGLWMLLLDRRSVPFWVRGVGLGWALGWSPWAWVALLPIALAGLARRGRRREFAFVLLLGLGVTALLSPPAILHPLDWAQDMRWRAGLEGLGSGIAPFGVRVGLWPLWATVHLPGLALLLGAACRWPGRVRAGDVLPLVFIGSLLLNLPSGMAARAPLLMLLPWSAGEIGGAWWQWMQGSGGRMVRRTLLGLLAAAAIAAPLAVTIGRVWKADQDAAIGTDVVGFLESRLPARALVAHDLSVPAPEKSGWIWVEIPFNTVDPGAYRDAYWYGWYRGFDAVVIDERMVDRFLEHAEEHPEVIAFYLRLAEQAREQHVFGSRPGRRLRLFLLPDSGGDLGGEWREHLVRGAGGGLQGDFLARLGGALVRAGKARSGVELLAGALEAGYDDPGIYVNLGSGHLALDRPLDAGRVFDEGLALYPDSPELLYNLALALVRVEYWERAARTLTKLRLQWPRSAQAAYLLGVSLANCGRREGGLRMLEEALALSPSESEREKIVSALETLRRTP